MKNYEEQLQDYWFGQPVSPSLSPIFGAEKLWEMENDYSYLKYLYSDIGGRIRESVEEECDKLEYDGSFIFDAYPDKLSLQLLAGRIHTSLIQEDAEKFSEGEPHIRELIEIILYNEILFRRNRYRTRKRLYF